MVSLFLLLVSSISIPLLSISAFKISIDLAFSLISSVKLSFFSFKSKISLFLLVNFSWKSSNSFFAVSCKLLHSSLSSCILFKNSSLLIRSFSISDCKSFFTLKFSPLILSIFASNFDSFSFISIPRT